LNPKISTTNTTGADDSSHGNAAATSVGTSATTGASTCTASSTTDTNCAYMHSASKKHAETKVSTDPPSITGSFLLRDASSLSRTGGSEGGGKPRLPKRWTVEEEKQLASAVETFGIFSWAKIAANVPGRNETQCSNKWWNMSMKAVACASGAWAVEEEKKLVSAVETLGTTSWTKVAVNVPGRNESQCSNKWWKMSKKAAVTVSDSGTWTVEEEKKLYNAIETFGTTSWAKIAANVPVRNETQCSKKWHYLSKKAAATASGVWTAEEEKKLVYAVETLGATSWAKVAANVPGRNETKCSNKWQKMSKKAAATASGAWTVEEEMKLASAVETLGTTSWAKIAATGAKRDPMQQQVADHVSEGCSYC
jgi:hypothetical protein